MEESDIRELIEEAIKSRGGELETVEIDRGDGGGRFIVRWVAAEKAFVVTNI